VFLISLKAGGTGLNLTAADTVIHFDPWWNPAVEAQATDRAHRIGQQNVVTSIKLVARDTVEQRVLDMQEKKRALLTELLDPENSAAPALDADELVQLIG
jgi:SNF2 family DNA or RNA helicase